MVQKEFFQAVSTQWSSVPKGKIHGTRKILTIKNGKGFQINENLNVSGKVIHRHKHTIKNKKLSGARRHGSRGSTRRN